MQPRYNPSGLAWRFSDQHCWKYTQRLQILHTRKLTWNLKIMVFSRNLLFQGFMFRFHASFRECRLFYYLVVEPTHLKNIISSNWIYFPRVRDENQKSLKPPHRLGYFRYLCYINFRGNLTLNYLFKPNFCAETIVNYHQSLSEGMIRIVFCANALNFGLVYCNSNA